MVADMVAFVAPQFTTSTWDVGAQELCSVVLINHKLYAIMLVFGSSRMHIRCARSFVTLEHGAGAAPP